MNRRTSIGLDDDDAPLDVSDVVAKPKAVSSPPTAVRGIAASEGFQGRTQQRPRYSRITGRTEQFNVRIKAQTKAEIYAIADEHRWGLGETMEKLLEAFRARSL